MSAGLVSSVHAPAFDLLAAARQALRAAKQAGRDRFVWFSPQMAHSARGVGMGLADDLHIGISDQQLRLHYQPIVQLDGNKVTGVEALVRWRHPERGLVPPDEFVPLAESSGLMVPLTAWVLDAALSQLAVWRARGWDLGLAVNVSVKDLCGDQLVDRVTEGLVKYGIPAASLQLEVTEGSLFSNSMQAQETLLRLEALGVTLSLDDFGTGWSSLVQLRQLSVREIKVDRSFVSRMEADPRDLAIVTSVIDLGRGLGMRVIAEGVEDLATWRRLSDLGCHGAQGWWLSKALPAAELDPWLAEQLSSYGELEELDRAQA